jgi:uncharacterized protein (DUF2062 family)
MAKRFLRRYLPHPDQLRQYRSLRIFSRWLKQSDLWHLNRRSASMGLGIGLFMAFMPMPLQVIPSTAVALLVRANLPLAIAGVWLTNPFTVPPLYFMCYRIGTWVLGLPALPIAFDPSWTWLRETLVLIWQPFVLGCFIAATVSGTLGYVGVRLLWRWNVIRAWEKRKMARARRKKS